ncbi:MAG: ion transporter [Deltaproteobacteria bacterium]|nr:ion transporter [Deltaproteobacteria bacterium]
MSALLHRAFHQPETSLYVWVQWTIWLLILVSVGVFTADLSLGPEHPLAPLLHRVDRGLMGIFAVEISLRILSWRPPTLDVLALRPWQRLRAHLLGRLVFALRPMNLVDLVTVAAVFPALRGLRAIRLLRLLRAVPLFHYAHPLQGIERAFRDNILLYGMASLGLVVTTLLGGVTIYLVESPLNPSITHLSDGLWWAAVTLTTVGYGDITPITPMGRLIGVGMMGLGMFILALFAGIVGHTLLHAVLSVREEQFRMSHFVNHVVVCGYDPGARMLLDALLVELDPETTPLVIFAPGERPVEIPSEFVWVNGDPTKESELDKVRLTHAEAALLVGSRQVQPQIADAVTILVAFTIRSFMRKKDIVRRKPLYLTAEILDEENVVHARAAGVDEVIETTRIGFSLMAHAVHMHGSADILSKVVSAGANSLFVGSLPDDVPDGTPFAEVARQVKAKRGALIIGLRHPQTRVEQLNPPDHVLVSRPVQILYLAEGEVLPQ